MVTMTKNETLRGMHFLRGLNNEELDKLSTMCRPAVFEAGEYCQKEGEQVKRVNFIVNGKIGVSFHVPGIAFVQNDLILYTLNEGGVFGWSALIEGIPWSTMKVLERTEVLSIDAQELLDLCESNTHLGYILMRNLSSLVSSRLKRNRMALLNAIVAIR